MIILVALTFVSINTLQKTAWAPMPFAKTVFQLLSCLTRRTPASSLQPTRAVRVVPPHLHSLHGKINNYTEVTAAVVNGPKEFSMRS